MYALVELWSTIGWFVLHYNWLVSTLLTFTEIYKSQMFWIQQIATNFS